MPGAPALFGDPAQAAAYAAHRPSYPASLMRDLAAYASAGLGRPIEAAVDAAAGSGQAALALAAAVPGVRRIVALDASPAQVAAATDAVAAAGKAATVAVVCAPAEDTGLPPSSADLVIVAQALHWLDVPAFYREAARLLRPGGAVAVLSYSWPTVVAGEEGGRVMPASTAALRAAAHEPPLGGLWDAGRALIDAGLPGLDPPGDLFEEVERRGGEGMRAATTARGVAGYVRSWSAYARHRREAGEAAAAAGDPADRVEAATIASARARSTLVLAAAPPVRPRRTRPHLCVRAHAIDPDDEIIPLLGPRRASFSPEELEALAHPRNTLGGKTIGEELALIRTQYVEAEASAAKSEARLHTASKGGNWEGDVYVGGAWNELTWLSVVAAGVPLAGLVFAVATKGVLWGLVDYYGY